jgi:two-component system, cell cycle sensor histidine kinase and response regulator CckA
VTDTGADGGAEPERELMFQARVLDALDQAIAATGPDGRVRYWNRQAVGLFGWSREEALGQELAELVPVLSPGGGPAAVADEVSRGGRWSGELVVRHRDGREFPADSTAVPVRGESGEMIGVVRTWSDATGRHHRESRLRQALVADALAYIAGGSSHDFNNVLTAIRGYAGFLVQDLPDGAQREDAREIHAATDRALSLTRQLFALGDRQVVEPDVLDLNAVVTGMPARLAPLLGDAIEIVVELAADLPAVSIRRAHLEQVIVNLALNAGEAMPKGGTLTLATRRSDHAPEGYPHADPRCGGVELLVADTGSAHPPDLLPCILDPLLAPKGARRPRLGLTTVYGIVRQAGGDVRVRSGPDAGSGLIVALPGVPLPGRQPEHRSPAR